MRLIKAGLGLLTIGIMVAIAILGTSAAPDKEPPSVEAQMAEAAQNLLDGLPDELRAKAQFAFNDPVRVDWHYYPITPEPRKGAVLKAMSQKQKELVKALLRAGTSKEGYEQALNVIALDGILRDIENTEWARKFRDPDLYYVCIFGKPAPTGKWGWRIEGHHLSLDYVIEDGKATAATPIFFGADPGEVPSGPSKGLRVMAREEDLARQLYTSLDSAARRKATIGDLPPFDVLTEVKVQPKPLPLQGLAYKEMDAQQRDMLEKCFRLYAEKHPRTVADRLFKEATDAGRDGIHFGWAGSGEPGQPHYYRIQGATFVVEFCNSQNRANHIHSLWRSYAGDFGKR